MDVQVGARLLTSHSMFRNGEFADMTISCKGRTWKGHRNVLCARCPFFKAACTSGFKVSWRQHFRAKGCQLDDLLCLGVRDSGHKARRRRSRRCGHDARTFVHSRQADNSHRPPRSLVHKSKYRGAGLFDWRQVRLAGSSISRI